MFNWLAAIPAVAKILEILKSLVLYLVNAFKKKPEDVIVENDELIQALKNAKDRQERLDAAKKIQDLLD